MIGFVERTPRRRGKAWVQVQRQECARFVLGPVSKWGSLVGVGAPLEEGIECPVRDVRQEKCRVFERDMTRGVSAGLLRRLHAGSLEKEDGRKLGQGASVVVSAQHYKS